MKVISCLKVATFLIASTIATTKVSLATEVICLDTTYARAETKGYYVNICGNSNGPSRYIGSSKSGQALVIPLSSFSDGKYIARSGEFRYTLTRNFLTVTQNGRTILKQKVISWR